jgi:hypothetical protein
LNFPNVINDDCVDATSQAIKYLIESTYREVSEVVTDTTEGVVHPQDGYRIGLVPARIDEFSVLVVYNETHSSVVQFERVKYESIEGQIDKAFHLARHYNNATVYAESGIGDALIRALRRRGASIKRVEMNQQAWTQAYENLSLLIHYKQITLPDDPDLLAELEVFRSETRLDARPDYSLQAGQSSAIRAICLVTYNVHPEIEAKTYGFKGKELPDDVFSVLRGTRAYFDRINEKEEFDFDFDGEEDRGSYY